METIPGTEINPFYSPKGWRMHWLLLFLLMLLNVYLSTKFPEVLSLGRIILDNEGQLWTRAVLVVVVGWNTVGFIFGNFAAMIPIKNYTYAQKYGKISMLCMIGIQILATGYSLYRLSSS